MNPIVGFTTLARDMYRCSRGNVVDQECKEVNTDPNVYYACFGGYRKGDSGLAKKLQNYRTFLTELKIDFREPND